MHTLEILTMDFLLLLYFFRISFFISILGAFHLPVRYASRGFLSRGQRNRESSGRRPLGGIAPQPGGSRLSYASVTAS